MAHPSIRTYRRYFSTLSLKAKGQAVPAKQDQARVRILARASGQ